MSCDSKYHLRKQKLIPKILQIDVMKPEQLDSETKAMLDSMLKAGDIELLQLSCTTTEGVSEVKNAACGMVFLSYIAS